MTTRIAINDPENAEFVAITNAGGHANLVLVCEHASCFIPPHFNSLGLDAEAATSHVAWDPGAYEVALELSSLLDAPLVAQQVSRLVYDCNRPQHDPRAMPEKSEIYVIPGNKNLSDSDKLQRKDTYYTPFHNTLAETISNKCSAGQQPDIITIHSFTPVFLGKKRAVEIGVLHDEDTRLADKLLARCAADTQFDVQRNAPYGAEDKVTHTLLTHAIPRGLPNVMLEIRNDLIDTPSSQKSMAKWLAQHILSVRSDAEARSA